jgi:hypothetical protein
MSIAGAAPVPPSGDFIQEAIAAFRHARHSGVPMSTTTKRHIRRVAEFVEKRSESSIKFLRNIEEDVWICVGGYFNAAGGTGHSPTDAEMVVKAKATAIAVLAAVLFDTIENGTHVHLLRETRDVQIER